MKSYQTLPEGYAELRTVDLQKDKKLALLVNGLALVIAAVMVVPMLWAVPIAPLFDMSAGLGAYLLRFGALLVGMVVYMVLHELTHGVAMKLCGTRKIQYGFTGLYAFAGSEEWYDKRAYLFIALAPVVLWGVVLAVVNGLVPVTWFWVVYLLQVINISGAAGDAYVTVAFSRMPRDILVRDSGVSMVVYARQA